MGRHSIYTEEIATAICDRIAGGESLLDVCRTEGMPGYSTVRRWDSENAEFRAMHARARDIRAHYLVDEIIKIADEATPETANVARNRCDQRKWAAARLLPKVYGDKLQHTGADGTGPVEITEVRRIIVQSGHRDGEGLPSATDAEPI